MRNIKYFGEKIRSLSKVDHVSSLNEGMRKKDKDMRKKDKDMRKKSEGKRGWNECMRDYNEPEGLMKVVASRVNMTYLTDDTLHNTQ